MGKIEDHIQKYLLEKGINVVPHDKDRRIVDTYYRQFKFPSISGDKNISKLDDVAEKISAMAGSRDMALFVKTLWFGPKDGKRTKRLSIGACAYLK